MSPIFDVKDKVVCIAGGSRGLGSAVARAFCENGAKVVVGAWDLNELNAVKSEFEKDRLTLTTCETDVSKRDDCKALVDATISTHQRIDVMICNAGIDIIKPAENYEEQEWDRILTINLRGYFYCTQFAATAMLEMGGGSIIMTSSVAGAHGIAGLAPYAASKGGINQLVKTTAVEWAKRGIRVNGVAPGYIENVMAGVSYDPNDPYQKNALSRTPMGRRGRLDEFVGAYLFLASNAATYITGTTIYIDGGFHAA
jgi:NAD(P)-dependent dehydrogenase (short-subunit alcohol dehydrogenase family)